MLAMSEKKSHRENVLQPISSNIPLQSEMLFQDPIKQSDCQHEHQSITKKTCLEYIGQHSSSILSNASENKKVEFDVTTENAERQLIACIESGDSKLKTLQVNFTLSEAQDLPTDSNLMHSSGDSSNHSQMAARQNSSFEDDEGFEDDCTAVEEDSVCDFDAATLESLLPADFLPVLSDPGHGKEDDNSDGGSEILELLHKSLTNFNEEVLAEHATKPRGTDLVSSKAHSVLNEKSYSVGSTSYQRTKSKSIEYPATNSPAILPASQSAQNVQQTVNLRKNERLDSGTFCDSFDSKCKSYGISKRNTFSANSSPKHQSFCSALSDTNLDRNIIERPVSLYSMTVGHSPPQLSFSQQFSYNEPPSYAARPILKLASNAHVSSELPPANKFMSRDKRHFQLRECPIIGNDVKTQVASRTFEFQMNSSQKRTRYKPPKEVHALPPLLQIAAKSREIESHLESTYVSLDHKKLPTGGSLPYPEKCKRACSFYLRGHCKKEDCEFAHDLTKVTCKFWQMGECFKGTTCPFLHGYLPENIII